MCRFLLVQEHNSLGFHEGQPLSWKVLVEGIGVQIMLVKWFMRFVNLGSDSARVIVQLQVLFTFRRSFYN